MIDQFVWPERLDVLQHLVVLAIAYLLALSIDQNRDGRSAARACGPSR